MNFRHFQQSITSPPSFASCRNHRYHTGTVSYVALAECVRDLLLYSKLTVIYEKWLPAETVRVIVLPAESLGRKQNHADSAGSHLSCTAVSAGSNSQTLSAEAKYAEQSGQEAREC